MDVTKSQPIPFDFSKLKAVTEELQSGQRRNTTRYGGLISGIAQCLNTLGRGVITRIDIVELQEQLGHLLYFYLKEEADPVPFDIECMDPLKSHFKNPTIMVLKRIRRYLMAGHRKVLAKLEEDQARERRIDFNAMDINNRIKKGLEEMQRFQTMASLTPSKSRKLDILTKALHVPAQFHGEFRLLDRILDDTFHLRHRPAMDWLSGSIFQGNLPVLRKVVQSGLSLLERKSAEIFDEMEKISGFPFERNTAELDPGFNWFSLGTPLRRGEDFVRIFEHEERIENALKRLTFFIVRATWDVAFFQERVDKNIPALRTRQENCTQLARIYFELEQKIASSTDPGGEVQQAITTDVTHGNLSDEEAQTARSWVLSNKSKLQALKIEIFRMLTEQKLAHPEIALPEDLEALMEDAPGEGTPVGNLPKISILDLHRQVEIMEDRMAMPDGNLLADLIKLRNDINERKASFTAVDFQRQVRAACKDLESFEEKILEYEKVETRLDTMRVNVDNWIVEAWREVLFSEVDTHIIEEAFNVVMDNMLASLKVLDYDCIDAEQFQEYFDQAITLEDEHALHQLDQLLHEVHSIPRQNQLLPALSDWESTLSRKEFEEKQSFILENEIRLQSLVDAVRAELRERIASAHIKPRRLRFEVFSLADCYSGNLKGLLGGLLRMAGTMASEVEGNRLIANIQAIESQIIEAQRITKPGGEAYDKLKELKRLNLLPPEVIEELYKDMEENFKDLDVLLKLTNDGLERVRGLQNRFGGTHDTSHLSVIINIHDLESLKKIYHFVDSITMMDIKRFGVIYKQKTSLMNDLYERAYNNDESVPENIAKHINAKAYKQFKSSHVVPLDLKIEILKEMPEILEFECELLIRTLNLVAAEQVRNKAVYKSILKIVEKAKGAGRERRRVLRRIWVKFRSSLQTFQPKNFKANFDNNTRALVTDVNGVVGSLFEDL